MRAQSMGGAVFVAVVYAVVGLGCGSGSTSSPSSEGGGGGSTAGGGGGAPAGGGGGDAARTAGAQLPVTYQLTDLAGTIRYVAPTGSDVNGDGAVQAPYATLKKAVQSSSSGDTIVLRGGTYPITANAVRITQANLTVIAYPGELPIFDGSIPAPATATEEGALRLFSYQPVPAGLGEGMQLTNLPAATFNGTVPTGLAASRGFACVTGASSYVAPTSLASSGCASGAPYVITGYYPDQVWVDDTALIQVTDKSLVVPGTFYVARAEATDAAPVTTSLYVTAGDAVDLSKVRVSSSTGHFIQISANGVRLEGLRIVRHSPRWSEYAVLVNGGVSGAVLRNVELDSNAAIAVKLAGGSTVGGSQFVRSAILDHVTARRSGWLGAVVLYSDDPAITSSLFEHVDPHGEFVNAPQRGAIKVTKTHRMRVVDSLFQKNTGFNIWWDQSCYDAVVARTKLLAETDAALFFEISHGLTLVDSLVVSTSTTAPGLRLVGSSGLRLVNDSLVGGQDVVLIHTDDRSKTYLQDGAPRTCSEHLRRYDGSVAAATVLADCNVAYTSEFDMARPGAYAVAPAVNLTPGMNWMPALDLMVNNVIANPTASGSCGAKTGVCVVAVHSGPAGGSKILVSPDTILRSAARVDNPVITRIDGNVYQADGTIFIVRTDTGQSGAVRASSVAALAGASGLGSSFYGFTGSDGTAVVEASGRSAASGLVDADGAPTAALVALYDQAVPVPVDATLNAYVPAGTRHYGALTW
jgi:hypothetical protein